jgi:hypothetical protein
MSVTIRAEAGLDRARTSSDAFAETRAPVAAYIWHGDVLCPCPVAR